MAGMGRKHTRFRSRTHPNRLNAYYGSGSKIIENQVPIIGRIARRGYSLHFRYATNQLQYPHLQKGSRASPFGPPAQPSKNRYCTFRHTNGAITLATEGLEFACRKRDEIVSAVFKPLRNPEVAKPSAPCAKPTSSARHCNPHQIRPPPLGRLAPRRNRRRHGLSTQYNFASKSTKTVHLYWKHLSAIPQSRTIRKQGVNGRQ